MRILILLLAALLVATTAAPAKTIDKRLLGCIAHVVYGEARGEPIQDQIVIGHSVILRAEANQRYFGGSDPCDVAYKMTPGSGDDPLRQYDGAYKKIRDAGAWKKSLRVARMVLSGIGRPTAPITYFCNPTRSKCSWHGRYLSRISIGDTGGQHRFYVDPRQATPAMLVSYRR